ncbi:hypothetical protein HDU93_000078 [Gonapodya sp. JEL0774]|nr:hypothetical protein HDU93_000078 [Gonapodya sp. JEL0774]
MNLHPSDLSLITRSPTPSYRLARLMTLWACKEALVKATGDGLAGPGGGSEVGFAPVVWPHWWGSRSESGGGGGDPGMGTSGNGQESESVDTAAGEGWSVPCPRDGTALPPLAHTSPSSTVSPVHVFRLNPHHTARFPHTAAVAVHLLPQLVPEHGVHLIAVAIVSMGAQDDRGGGRARRDLEAMLGDQARVVVMGWDEVENMIA